MTEAARYEALEELVVAWYRAGEDALVSGCWRPTAPERRIADDVLKVTLVPAVGEPPYDGEPLWCSLTRVSRWAAVFRLAALAGRWDLPQDAGPPAGYEDMDLEKLVGGLYPFFALIERRSELHSGLWEEKTEDTADARLEQIIPSVRSRLCDAERVHIHFITMMLGNVLKDDVAV
ncbi:hypothetical protein [Streptomyces nodosus]|uniref:hypothetical protein n=1 Tax=Streptomyces nodosus TaxID=40318 RepID=UPI0038004746